MNKPHLDFKVVRDDYERYVVQSYLIVGGHIIGEPNVWCSSHYLHEAIGDAARRVNEIDGHYVTASVEVMVDEVTRFYG